MLNVSPQTNGWRHGGSNHYLIYEHLIVLVCMRGFTELFVPLRLVAALNIRPSQSQV